MTEKQGRNEAKAVQITNFVSWGHYISSEATLKVRRLVTLEAVKKILHGKKIEAFWWPDSELMGKLSMYGALPSPIGFKTPQEAEEVLTNAFFTYLNNGVVEQIGRPVKELGKPAPLETGSSVLICQFALIPSSSLIETSAAPTMKIVWYEIEALEVAAKPAPLAQGAKTG